MDTLLALLKKVVRGISWVLVAILLIPIWIYQKVISPYTPASCRFTPTWPVRHSLNTAPSKDYIWQCAAYSGVILGAVRVTTRCPETA